MTALRRRVCLVAPEFIGPFPNGGVGTACYWEAATLAAAGYDVTVLYTGSTDRETPEHWEAWYSQGAFTYVDLWRAAVRGEISGTDGRTTGTSDTRRRDLLQPCPEADTADLVFRFLRDRSFDLLLFQEFLGHGARTLQARRSGEALADTPAAVTLHSCRQWIYEGMKRLPSSRQDLYVDFLERESARLADYVIAPSRHMAEWAAAHWRLEDTPAVIPYCYDEKIEGRTAQMRHEGPFEQLVFFGRLETRKGLHLFCRALAREGARGPVNKVTFLGKGSTVEGRPSEEFIRATLGGIPGLEIQIISSLGSLEALDWLERQRNSIVIAPSLVDNLPYAVIELFARRLPLISNRIGGIPEIVGERNAHALAEPAPESLADALTRAHRDGHLTIDYRAGYSIAAANRAHLDYVQEMLEGFRRPVRTLPDTCDFVLVDVADEALAEARERVVDADAAAGRAAFYTWPGWCRHGAGRAAIFLSRDVTPRAGMMTRLLRALSDHRVAAATACYESGTAADTVAIAPLGSSLEAGWAHNVFGGRCFAATGGAIDLLRAGAASPFHFWAAYAALACADLELAIVPDVLFSSPQTAAGESHDAIEAVARQYREHAPSRLDLGWLIKYAGPAERARSGAPGVDPTACPGRALYDHLLAIPDAPLQAYSGLNGFTDDPFIRELKLLRVRLAEIREAWRATNPRVFMYGAGQHARLVLALEPEIGRFIAGFIDRRPVAEFLGKPCIRPEAVTPAIADAVLYSSREYERDMFARLAQLPIEHVLLYAESPPAEPAALSTRMRRRFGHATADTTGLHDVLARCPGWIEGGMSWGDSEFLLELVAGVSPGLVLELGVASGTSSSALLFALDSLPALDEGRILHSCDVRNTCYFDPNRPTGSAVGEMYPCHRTPWRLDTQADARRVSLSLGPESVDLTFIDANHCHPWPLLDLLHITRIARPGSWVALHDIELPRLHPQFQVHGPQWLFEAWPFNKVHGLGDSTNVGAVQLPMNLKDLIPMSLALLDRPWEHTPTSAHVDLPPIFSEISKALVPRLPDPVRAA